MAKYLSGRQKVRPFSGLSTDRHLYLGLDQAEPNLGYPGEKNVAIATTYYQLVTIDNGTTYDRYWKEVDRLTILDEGNILGTTTSINFTGLAVTAILSSPGSIAEVKVFSPGNNGEILFNSSNEFSTSSKLKFDSSSGLLSAGDRINVGFGGTVITTINRFVGIGSTIPTKELDINGSIKINKGIYDKNDSPGADTYVPIADGVGGWSWQPVTQAGAGVLDGFTVKDEGSIVGTAGSVTFINFVGSNITATASGSGSTVTLTEDPTFNSLRLNGVFYDINNQVGAGDSILVSTGTGVSWTSVNDIALQGLQGIQGTQGIQGLQGIQGTQGIQGIQGFQGIQGTQGSQGTQGITGSQGTQGIQGIQGADGTGGTQGIQDSRYNWSSSRFCKSSCL